MKSFWLDGMGERQRARARAMVWRGEGCCGGRKVGQEGRREEVANG